VTDALVPVTRLAAGTSSATTEPAAITARELSETAVHAWLA
jgi:hypothetical protein